MRAWFNCTHLFGSPLALTYGARLYQLKVSEWPSWHEALALRLSTAPGISSVPPSVATNLQYYNSSKRNRYSYNTGFCSSVLCYWHLQIVFLLVVIIYCMYSPVPLPQIHHFGTPWPLPETAPPSLHLLYHLIVQDHMVVHIHWNGPLEWTTGLEHTPNSHNFMQNSNDDVIISCWPSYLVKAGVYGLLSPSTNQSPIQIYICHLVLYSHFRVISSNWTLYIVITHTITVLEGWSLTWIPMV